MQAARMEVALEILDAELGDAVVHAGWRDYAVIDAATARRIEPGLPSQAYLGALGFPGLTAYVGLTPGRPIGCPEQRLDPRKKCPARWRGKRASPA